MREFRHYLSFSGPTFLRSQIKYRGNITFQAISPVNKDGKRQISWQAADDSLYFKANDDKLNFDNRVNLANANDCSSGGLLFLGLCLN